MTTLRGFLAALCVALIPALAGASTYPDRPVKIVVAFAPGGPVDLLARNLAKHLQTEMGQPFVVESRAGAGGIIGTAHVAKATPDGYTLLLVANGHAILPSTTANMPYDTVKDFNGVGMLGAAPYVLVVRPQLGVKSIQELGDLAKQRDKPMFYGTPGPGTANHLAVQMLADHFNIPFQQVTYKGAAPATQALLAGDVDFIINNLTSSLPLIEAGQLLPLGLTGKAPEGILPGVPLISETIPGFEALAWYGVVAPAGTPADIVSRLSDAMAKVSENPEFRTAILGMGVEPRTMSGPDFDRYIGEDIKKWADLAKRAGVKPE